MSNFLPILTRSRNELAHRLQDHIVELGLMTDEFLVIWSAVDDPQASAATIRKRLGLRQSTFTSMVARLVDRGYLRTRTSRRDRRTRYLIPTRPGLMAARIARAIHLDLEDLARPYDADETSRGLGRLDLLIGQLPEPILMEDGLPLVTA